jgi:hypothetical protein
MHSGVRERPWDPQIKAQLVISLSANNALATPRAPQTVYRSGRRRELEGANGPVSGVRLDSQTFN